MKSDFRIHYSILLCLIFIGCGKKESASITNDNKREALIEYGKQNLEKNVIIETDLG